MTTEATQQVRKTVVQRSFYREILNGDAAQQRLGALKDGDKQDVAAFEAFFAGIEAQADVRARSYLALWADESLETTATATLEYRRRWHARGLMAALDRQERNRQMFRNARSEDYAAHYDGQADMISDAIGYETEQIAAINAELRRRLLAC